MRKRQAHHRRGSYSDQPVAWLPIDSRLFPFFSFSHVRGAARIFLIVEIVLSVTIVIATLFLVIITKIH